MLAARNYAYKAIQADPDDIPLKYDYADLCLNAGKYKEAAETYEQIFCRCPEKTEALKWGIEVHKLNDYKFLLIANPCDVISLRRERQMVTPIL